MEDMQSGRCGPQIYLLSEEGYERLRDLQAMLVLMAHITYSKGDGVKSDATLTIGRAELCFIFEAINLKIDDVLERLGNENWLGSAPKVSPAFVR